LPATLSPVAENVCDGLGCFGQRITPILPQQAGDGGCNLAFGVRLGGRALAEGRCVRPDYGNPIPLRAVDGDTVIFPVLRAAAATVLRVFIRTFKARRSPARLLASIRPDFPVRLCPIFA